MTKTADGTVYFDRQLYDFLAERYALETELSLLNATQTRYVRPRYELLRDLVDNGLDAENQRRRVSHFVAVHYGITDRRVLRLAGFSLFDIFRGVPFRAR